MKKITAALFALVTHRLREFRARSTQKPAPFETKKVDGTDNVYIFRFGGAQSMFIVTSAGVIATDPISYANRKASAGLSRRDQGRSPDQPVKYVIYSHHHFDHIAGGKPFKNAGARSSRTRLRRTATPKA